MANAVKSQKFTVAPMVGVIKVNRQIEPSAEEAESLPFYIDGVENYPEWTYSASAEDNGTAGILDLEDGLIYVGDSGMYVQVSIRDLDLTAAIGINSGTPENNGEDTMELALYVNSVPVAHSDEGRVAEMDAGTPEFNLDAHVGPLNENDVLRVVINAVGEEADADTQISESAVITIR